MTTLKPLIRGEKPSENLSGFKQVETSDKKQGKKMKGGVAGSQEKKELEGFVNKGKT